MLRVCLEHLTEAMLLRGLCSEKPYFGLILKLYFQSRLVSIESEAGSRVRRDNMKPERHIKTPFGEAWEYNAQRNRRRTPACNPSNFVFCYSFSVQCFHLLLYPVHIVLPGCLRHMRRERSWCHNGFFSGLNWLFALRTYLYDSISHMFSVIFSPVHSQQVENATWWFHAKYVGMALVLPWKSMCWIVESRVSATQCSPRPTRILDDFVSWLLGSQFKTCFFGMGHADTSEEIFCLDDWQIVSSPAASIQWGYIQMHKWLLLGLSFGLYCSLYWLFWISFSLLCALVESFGVFAVKCWGVVSATRVSWEVFSVLPNRKGRWCQQLCSNDLLDTPIDEVVSPTSSLMTQLVPWVVMNSDASTRDSQLWISRMFPTLFSRRS